MPLPVDDQVDAVTLGELTVRQRRGQEDPVVPLIVVQARRLVRCQGSSHSREAVLVWVTTPVM